jgi:hypothetical protein
VNYRTYKTTNRWRSFDAPFHVLSIQHLLPLIIVFILIWLYRVAFCLIDTQPCGKAERRYEIALFTLTGPKMMYHAKRFIVPAIHLFMNRYSQATYKFAQNISLTETLSQATYSWLTIDAFCPTFSSLLYFSAFQHHWRSLKPFQPGFLSSVSAEPIWGHLVQRSQAAALGNLDSQGDCCALYWSHRPYHNPLPCHLDHPSCHSSLANLQCPKCFQVRYRRHFGLVDGWFSEYGRHSRFEFVLQGSPFKTMLGAKVVFLTI